jgi:hypothetical protein
VKRTRQSGGVTQISRVRSAKVNTQHINSQDTADHNDEQRDNGESIDFDDQPTYDMEDQLPQNTARPHESTKERKTRKRTGWDEKINSLYSVLLEEESITSSHCSQQHCNEPAQYRCVSCYQRDGYCRNHLMKNHCSNRLKLHIVQDRQHDDLLRAYKWVTLSEPPWSADIYTTCTQCRPDTYSSKNITFVDYLGQQKRNVIVCNCFTIDRSIYTLGFFPATPQRPVTAFSIKLLKHYRDLNLICHVNQHQFAELIAFNSYTKAVMTEIEVYRSIQGCYRVFSYLMGQIAKGRTIGNTTRVDCPCCMSNKKNLATVTFDACFGCTGKESNARNTVAPFHGEDYILQDLTEDQVLVDIKLKLSPEELIKKGIRPDVIEKEACELRATEYTGAPSSKYFSGLRFTGLMGSVCKHGFPLYFMNIMYGKEKMVFASRVWEHMRDLDPTRKWNAKYDVMCVFEKYLRDRGRKGPDITAIPSGHARFHRWLCQELWGTLSVPGNGLSVGEEIELLWKELMHIWSRLKEMSPENRRDELTDHLMYRSEVCLKKLHQKLEDFADRAEKTYQEAKKAIDTSDCGLTEATADAWYSLYSTAIAHSTIQTLCWQEKYAGLLYDLYNNQWVPHNQFRKGQTLRSEKTLMELILQMEKQKGVSPRWEQNSILYTDWLQKYWRTQMEICRKKVVMFDNDQFFYVETMRHTKHGRKNYKKRVDTAKLISKASVARHIALEQWNGFRSKLYPNTSAVSLEQFIEDGYSESLIVSYSS